MNNIVWKTYPASEFDAHKMIWDELNNQKFNSPLLSSIFVSLLIKHFGVGSEILAIATVDSKPVAATVIKKKSIFSWQTFQPSQAPIGLWISNHFSIEQLVNSLQKTLSPFCLLLDITQIDPDMYARTEKSSRSRTMDYIETARITISSNFEDYWNDRGKNLRSNLKKQRNKLTKENIEVKLECINTPNEIDIAIINYGELEASGWKNKKGTAVRVDNAQGKFYRDLIRALSGQNEARIYAYKFNEKIVAIDLCINNKDQIIILKTTYDESFKNLSPALLLKQDYFKEIFETNFKVIEFYGRLMEWHTKWSKEIRILYHQDFVRSAILNRLRQ